MPAATAYMPDDSIPGHIAQTPNRNTIGKRLQSSRQKCREYPYLPIALSYRIRANSSNVASGLGFHPDSRCRGLVSKRKRGGYPMTSSPRKKILAARYSPTGDSRSTLATGALHFCVRYGNRCCYSAMATRKKATEEIDLSVSTRNRTGFMAPKRKI